MLLRALGTFIFVLFLSKEYIYVNEEFFVIVCFLCFVLGFIVYCADLVRDSFDSAISEIRTTLSAEVISYGFSLDQISSGFTKTRDSLDLIVPLAGSVVSSFVCSQQPLKKDLALVNSFLAHTTLLFIQEKEKDDEASAQPLSVDSFVHTEQLSVCPALLLEPWPEVNAFGNFAGNQDMNLLMFMNLLTVRALV